MRIKFFFLLQANLTIILEMYDKYSYFYEYRVKLKLLTCLATSRSQPSYMQPERRNTSFSSFYRGWKYNESNFL